MDAAFKTFQFTDGRKLELHHDPDPMNPREWDNNGIMVCFHSRHDLGDKHDHDTPQDFLEWKKEQGDDVIACLPLYLYDHSGITMSTGPFSCRVDSCQVGWIVATRESLKSGGHDVDKLDVAKVEEWLRGEVTTYDQYLTGDICGFVLRDQPCEHCDDETGDVLDSCWGFFGDDLFENGILDHLDEKYRDALMAEQGISPYHLPEDAVKVVVLDIKKEK